MSRFVAESPLAALHLALSALALIWNVACAGRIARFTGTPRPLAALSAITAVALVPALLVAIASGSLLEGRALFAAAWVWPMVVTIVAIEALYALIMRRVAPAIGTAIAAYDLVLAVAATVHYAIGAGAPAADVLVGVAAAPTTALATFVTPFALAWPLSIFVPVVAPAVPARRGAGTVLRSTIALLAAVWLAMILSAMPESEHAVASYARYDVAQMQERSADSLSIGLKILPTLENEPSPLALASDIALADSLGVSTLGIYVAPTITNAALDSLGRALDEERSGKTLLVALDLRDAPEVRSIAARRTYLGARLATLDRIMRRLHPDYLVPAVDPFGAVARAMGPLPVGDWERFLLSATTRAHGIDPDVTVLAHVGGTTQADSALFAWAERDSSTVDGAGISLAPSYDGAASLDARMETVDRWMRTTTPRNEVWVMEASGYPALHGEQSQVRSLWRTIVWATRHQAVNGLMVLEASDYDVARGLRAPGGRLRPARNTIARAIKALGESTPAKLGR